MPGASRRIRTGTAVLVTAVVGLLTACSGNPDAAGVPPGSLSTAAGSAGPAAVSPSVGARLAPAVDAALLPAVANRIGRGPELVFPSTAPPDGLQRLVLRRGSGAPVQGGDWVATDYVGQVWNGAVFDSTYQRGAAAVLQLTDLIPGWQAGLDGVPVGSQLLLSVPPAAGYGPDGNGRDIGGQDTIVFLVQVLDAFGPDRGGQPDAAVQPTGPGLPTVQGALGAEPAITIGDAPEPAGVSTTVIAVGTGDPARPAMPTGFRVLLQYKEVDWSGTTISSSWPGGPVATDEGLRSVPLMNEGTYAGLVGLPIGSRVLITVPADAAATGASAPATAVVVDLVAQGLA